MVSKVFFVLAAGSILAALTACGTSSPSETRAPVVAVVGVPPAPVESGPVANAKAKVIVVPNRRDGDTLWSVSSDGTIAQLAWPPPEARRPATTFSLIGSDQMAPSPDGRRVAYVEDGRLQIRDLETEATTEVTKAPADTELLITGWSFAGQQLLYALVDRLPGEPDDEAHAYDDPTYFRFDLQTRRTTRVELPGDYSGWLPSGEIVVAVRQALFAVSDGMSRHLTSEALKYGQVSVGPTKIVAAAVRSSGEGIIVEVDPRTRTTSPLSEAGRPADKQWPTLSPSEKRFAYVRHESVPSGHPLRTLVVDGKALTWTSDVLAYGWIDDETLFVRDSRGVAVLDAATGSPRGARAWQ